MLNIDLLFLGTRKIARAELGYAGNPILKIQKGNVELFGKLLKNYQVAEW